MNRQGEHPRTGSEARSLIRSGGWPGPTPGLAPGYVQANLAIVPHSLSAAFEQFCLRNPKPLPLLDQTVPGSPCPQQCAAGADVRTDVPKYRLFEGGRLQHEMSDLMAAWKDDWCAFLLGCSFTFDSLLAQTGVAVRHLQQGCNVPMYVTVRPLRPSGPFAGQLVVSMRPIPAKDVGRVVEMTRPLHLAHGAPVHVGAPEALGISNMDQPDYGDAVEIRRGEVPVFWACGVTAQQAAQSSRIPWMVTHAPGHMFITDWRVEDLKTKA